MRGARARAGGIHLNVARHQIQVFVVEVQTHLEDLAGVSSADEVPSEGVAVAPPNVGLPLAVVGVPRGSLMPESGGHVIDEGGFGVGDVEDVEGVPFVLVGISDRTGEPSAFR